MKRKPIRHTQVPQGPLLTISIMVSGREETTDQCIDSLNKLRENVPCELILTDTGCSPEFRNHLETKADRILDFTWCNDFAKARNVGLKAARGKWFMFLDDDEWFEDTTEIEHFFLSREYKKYESASYLVRNYVNLSGDITKRDTPVIRMVNLRKEIEFVYPIHETLWPIYEPKKDFAAFAHHNGYLYPNEDAERAKRKRNLDLLLPLLEEEGCRMHHYIHVIAEYVADEDHEAAMKIADRGVAAYDWNQTVENVNYIWSLKASAVRERVRLERDKEALKLGKETLETPGITDLTKATLYGDMAQSAGRVGDYEYCRFCVKQYYHWKEYFDKHLHQWHQQQIKVLDSAFETYTRARVLTWGLAACFRLKDYDTAEQMVASEQEYMLMAMLQNWYTDATVDQREEWKAGFEQAVNAIRSSGREKLYPRLLQTFQAVTVPPEEAQPASPPKPAPKAVTLTPELEAMAAQLREKIPVLLQVGEQRTALVMVSQLLQLFPEDPELLQWKEELESSL